MRSLAKCHRKKGWKMGKEKGAVKIAGE